MKKKYIFIFIILILFINKVNAADIMYPFVCDNINCYNTERKSLDNYYLIKPISTTVNNFDNYIDFKLEDFKDYYGTSTFEINNFCTGSCDSLSDKNITLTSLLNRKTEFHIGKKTLAGLGPNEIVSTYSSGLDYLLSNFKSVIDELHIGFPVGQKKSKLSDVFKNILTYNSISDNLELRNVCFDTDMNNCRPSKIKNISIYDNSSYKFLNGEIRNSTNFKNDTFTVSENYNLSDLFLKSGESLKFNFGFEDYLDTTSSNTEYEYRIYYNYDGEGIPAENDYFLKETINIKTSNYAVSSPNISDTLIPNIVKIDVLDSDVKKIRVGISEGIKLTKSGKINFYLSAKNVNTGDKFNIKLVNSVPVNVLPNDNVTKGNSQITSSFSEDLNSPSKGFNVGDTFSVTINLKDEFENDHYDFISGYDISLADGSSNFIELSKYGSNEYSKTLLGVETIPNNLPNVVVFKFRITEPGYHDLNGFNIKIRAKESNTIYENPAKYIDLKNIVPKNLYSALNQKMKIYIKEPTTSSLPISCGKVAKVNYTCTSDNFSGCNNAGNTTITYSLQTDNGKTGNVSIIDHAYNVKNYPFVINHVDTTAPEINVYKGAANLSGENYNYKANNDKLDINFYEWTTTSCLSEINYVIKINGVEIKSGIEYVSESKIILNDFFKTSGNKVLNIKSIDKYGNSMEKNISFNIFPGSINGNQSSVYLVGNQKNTLYADFSNNYTYKIILKDEFGNNITSKNLTSVNNECSNQVGCNNIYLDITNNSSENGLIESNYNGISNASGEITFNLKSYAPGLFSEIFKIRYHDWDDNYNNLSSEKTIYIGNNISINSFRKPFKGELLVSSNNGSTYNSIPEVGTNQKYKIKLSSNSSLSYTNGKLNIIENLTIKNGIIGHIFEDFSSIVNEFGSNISNYLGFTARINVEANVLKAPNITGNDLVISYNLNGKEIKYYLTKNDDGDDNNKIELGGEDKTTLGVKVVGNIQGAGKSDLTGQEKNFTDISLLEARSKIRKNAYKLIKGMSNGQELNGIKYVVGDISINGNLSYETLIVKDGNVIINGDLNQSGKKLGIIVLKDGYNVNTDYNKKGNIYINNGVKYINGILFADGGFISSNSTGNPYLTDSVGRTNYLEYQLVLKGSLFTRNTIGGSILAGGYYLLPGGKKINDFNKSMIYDLNYIRRSITGWDGADTNNDGNQYNKGFDDPFVIIYNSTIQKNPPKGFEN